MKRRRRDEASLRPLDVVAQWLPVRLVPELVMDYCGPPRAGRHVLHLPGAIIQGGVPPARFVQAIRVWVLAHPERRVQWGDLLSVCGRVCCTLSDAQHEWYRCHDLLIWDGATPVTMDHSGLDYGAMPAPFEVLRPEPDRFLPLDYWLGRDGHNGRILYYYSDVRFNPSPYKAQLEANWEDQDQSGLCRTSFVHPVDGERYCLVGDRHKLIEAIQRSKRIWYWRMFKNHHQQMHNCLCTNAYSCY